MVGADLPVHPSAIVHPLALVEGASIGARTRIWQFATIIRGARIGEDCNIASGACVDGSIVGDRTKIGHNLAAGPGFLIGSDVFIGPNVTLCNDAWPRADMIGLDLKRYAERPAIIIEDGASIGANAVILPGVVIGAGAMIAAGSVVTRDVAPGHLWRHGEQEPIYGEDKKRRMRFAGE